MSDAQTVLMGGGVPAASFENVGDEVSGTIVRIHDARQASDPVTKELKTWKDGSPILQVAIELDDGTTDGAMLYVQAGSERQRTLRDAVKRAGRNELEPGGYVYMKHTDSVPSTIKGAQPKKLYQAAYKAPASAGSNAVMSEPPTQADVAIPGMGQAQPSQDNADRQSAAAPASNTVDISHLPPEVQALIRQQQS